jgi:hypothetical protein
MSRQLRLQLQYVLLPTLFILCLPFVYSHGYDFSWIVRVEIVQFVTLIGAASSGLKKAAELYSAPADAEPSGRAVA